MFHPQEQREQYLQSICASDKHFAALPETEQRSYLDTFMEYGKCTAKDLASKYGSPASYQDLEKLAIENGVILQIITSKDLFPFLAEYTPRKKCIELYQTRIASVQEMLHDYDPTLFEDWNLMEMCVAHELFHHFEGVQFGTTGKIAGIRVGIFGRKHYFAQGSEIAAHEFVKELLQLPFSTFAFSDLVRVLYDQKKQSRIRSQSDQN